MACEYCNGGLWHDYRCPLYKPPKATHYCSICGYGIYDGEEYIINDGGEYAHYDCVSYGHDMANFLGYEIKTMEDDEH